MESRSVKQADETVNTSGIAGFNRSQGRLGYWYAQGKVGWLLLWLIGIPVPVLLGLFLLRGCT